MKRLSSTPLALLLVSLATPAAAGPCAEKVVLLPLEPVATDRQAALRTEEALRTALQRRWGECLEPRHETVARIATTGGELPTCADDACAASQVRGMGAKYAVRGVLLGVGGRRTLTLVAWGREGQLARTTQRLDAETPEAMQPLVAALWAPPPKKVIPRWVPHVTVGAGAAAVIAGAVFGVSSRNLAEEVSSATGGCPADQLSACLDAKLERGRQHALAANVLYVAGGALAAGGLAMFVWELP